MDRLILEEKLEALRHCVVRVEQRRTHSADELRSDPDRQDILTLNLTRAVQLCVDMATHIIAESEEPAPQTMGEAFDALAHLGVIAPSLAARMKSAVGFRNIAVHNYQTIDWDIVFAITHEGLGVFQEFAAAVDRIVDRGGSR
ncbi:MAG TPA: DUF86 domain-containing protein [Gammaproteobacteria bacterium]|nr:DUF86 domain-containing protein [Gammaproteobacteria bacterium]